MDLITNTGNATLPVELSSFTAQFVGSSPVLCWTTQSETGNAGWNVYRSESDDTEDMILINYNLILGSGTTSIPTDYSFEDVFPIIEGTTYFYWLECTNSAGMSDFSNVIPITIPENSSQGFFDFKEYLFGNIPAITLYVTGMDEYGNISVNGGVTGNPYTLEWDWGDGENTGGFFPQAHQYDDISQNYIITVTASYNSDNICLFF